MPWLGLAAEGGELLFAGGAAVEGAEAVGVGTAAAGTAAGGTAIGVGEALTSAQLAERLRQALALAATLAAAKAVPCQNCCRRTVVIPRSRAPESARHIDDAQALGFPSVLTYDPAGKTARRAASLKGIPTRPGYDRDEYPPAAFAENGGVADVRYVPSLDNQTAGGFISAGLEGATPGCIVTIKTGP